MPIDPAAGGDNPSHGAVARTPLVSAAACAFLVCLVVSLMMLKPWRSAPRPAEYDPSEAPGVKRPPRRKYRSVPHVAPGIQTPTTIPAAAAKISDSALVVGVRSGGKARAYLIGALSKTPDDHIVNDLLGDVPVTVVHCEVLNSTRAFTSAARGKPLELGQGGFLDDAMAITSAGKAYRLEDLRPYKPDDPPFEHADHPFEVTTWKLWKAENPHTDAYAPP